MSSYQAVKGGEDGETLLHIAMVEAAAGTASRQVKPEEEDSASSGHRARGRKATVIRQRLPHGCKCQDKTKTLPLSSSSYFRCSDLILLLSVCQSTRPGAPSLAASEPVLYGHQSQTVAFNPPADGPPTTSYFVRAEPIGKDVVAQAMEIPTPSSPATIPGLVPGQPYIVTVAAVNVTGRGPWSTPSNPIVPHSEYLYKQATFLALSLTLPCSTFQTCSPPPPFYLIQRPATSTWQCGSRLLPTATAPFLPSCGMRSGSSRAIGWCQ